jgi:hypothetical protein
MTTILMIGKRKKKKKKEKKKKHEKIIQFKSVNMTNKTLLNNNYDVCLMKLDFNVSGKI